MYKRKAQGWNKHIDFIIVDIIVTLVCFLLANLIKKGNLESILATNYRLVMLGFVFSSMYVAVIHNSHHNILKRGYLIELKETIIHNTLVSGMVVVMLFLIKGAEDVSRIMLGITYLLSIIGCYGARLFWKKCVFNILDTQGKGRRVLIVTNSSCVDRTMTRLRRVGFDFEIAGIVLADRDATGEYYEEYPIVCSLDGMKQYIINNVVDEVFFKMDRYGLIPAKLLMECQEMGITTHVNLLVSENTTEEAYIETFGGYTVLTTSLKVASQTQLFMKRTLDIIGGIVGCILTGGLCLYVVPKIKKADPGPAFFTQTRVGKHGRTFKIYKFRSMYMDAEERKKELLSQNEMDGIMFKMEHDPRILPGIGEFIRKTSIDEFPQFLNVLKGDMSLVGTRPPLQSEVDCYDPKHMQRLAVKPGITGLWQISGRSDITEFDEIVKLDAKYIREWNILMDIKILLKTVLVVLKGEGAR